MRDPLDAGNKVRTSPRMGGEVLRYHTWPTIRQQTVMDHTGNVIRIYWALFRIVPPEVTAYLLFHDLPEVVTGDPPHPLKAHNPRLKSIYDELEDEVLEDMVGRELQQEILGGCTKQQRLRMKLCDLLEMHEFAAIEIAMGNTFGHAIIKNIDRAIETMDLSAGDRAAADKYIYTQIRRFE